MSTFETDEHLQAPLHSRLAAECDSCHRARVQLISLCSETPSESHLGGVSCWVDRSLSGLRSGQTVTSMASVSDLVGLVTAS